LPRAREGDSPRPTGPGRLSGSIKPEGFGYTRTRGVGVRPSVHRPCPR
jgi:hypothetical protein